MRDPETQEQPGEAAPHDAHQKGHGHHARPLHELQGGPAFAEFLDTCRRLGYSDSHLSALLTLKGQARLLREELASRPMVDGASRRSAATVDPEARP